MGHLLREVAYVDANRRLRTMKISADSLPTARSYGWMVWDDFEATFNPPRLVIPQPDGDIGETR